MNVGHLLLGYGLIGYSAYRGVMAWRAKQPLSEWTVLWGVLGVLVLTQ